MTIKKPDEETRKSVREFFGITSTSFPTNPIPCNTFNTLVKIYSLLPDQQNNPFAKYANCPEYATTYDWPRWNVLDRNNSGGQRPDGVRDNSLPGRKKEASYVSDHPSGVEDLSFHNERKSDGTSGALCNDGVLSRPEMLIDALGMSKNSEVMDKIAYVEGSNAENNGFCNVHEDLSSIQRILMDESDDLDMLQLLDKDVNLDLAHDLSSILDMDRSSDNTLTMESTGSEKYNAGEITKEAVVNEKKRKDVEVNRSISGCGVGISQTQKSVNTGRSITPGRVNQNVTCIKDAQSKDKKLCEQLVSRELSEIGGLTSTGGESSGKFVDNSGRCNPLVVSVKAKKTKVKKAKKMSEKDVESGKHKLVSVEGEAYNSMKSGGDDPMVHGKTLKQNALGISRNPSTKEDKESWPKSLDRLQYNREQLLHLGKTTFVPEHIKKAAREIGAEIHEKHQISAAFAIADSSILKNRRGGSASEARKEKKKLKKRKKRAELNRKLGVKRLKLTPVVKPKVVQHCRHYLNGRCHEGEKCKFSHDVVPLTKSKPCCHFALRACMKGDDCPFDHQLSKYPCNNYVDTGFCNRGESCLFSHKVPAKEVSEPSATALKRDTSSVDQHDISKSKQQVDANVPLTSGNATPKNLKETLPIQSIQPAKRPKGLSFISFGKDQKDPGSVTQVKDQKDPGSVDQHNMSIFKQQVDVNVPLSSGKATPKNLKEMLPTQVIQPAKRPTGLSFISFGEVQKDPGSVTQGIDYPLSEGTLVDSSYSTLPPHMDNSSRFNSSGMSLMNDSVINHLEGKPRRSDYVAGTPALDRAIDLFKIFTPTPSPDRAVNLSEMSKGAPTPGKAKGRRDYVAGTPTPDRAFDDFKIFTPTSSPDRALNLSEMSKGAPTQVKAKGRSDYVVGTPTPDRAFDFFKIFTPTPSPDKALNLSEMFKGASTQVKAKGISASSSGEPSYDISGGFRVKGNINLSEASKEIQPRPSLWSSQSSSSQNSSEVDLHVKKPPSNSQRALQSALAFANKYGIKSSSMASTKENNLNEGASSGSSRQSEPLQASKILQFLNRQGDKEKQ